MESRRIIAICLASFLLALSAIGGGFLYRLKEEKKSKLDELFYAEQLVKDDWVIEKIFVDLVFFLEVSVLLSLWALILWRASTRLVSHTGKAKGSVRNGTDLS